MAELPDSTYAVLGLVDRLPGSSGYDLIAVADRSFGRFWPISQTLLYRELKRLSELSWVSTTKIDQESSPPKWVYESTYDGKDALVQWLAMPAANPTIFRSPVLLRFFFATHMTSPQIAALLASYRETLDHECGRLEVLIEKLTNKPKPGRRIGRLTAMHGLMTARARLQWVALVEAELVDGADR